MSDVLSDIVDGDAEYLDPETENAVRRAIETDAPYMRDSFEYLEMVLHIEMMTNGRHPTSRQTLMEFLSIHVRRAEMKGVQNDEKIA